MKKILVVDDSALMRRVLCDIIEQDERFQVADRARNGLEALELLEKNTYDAVVLDVNMPQMTGLQLLKELQKRKIPAKVMMASTDTKEGAKTTMDALELGALDFVHKPNNAIDCRENDFAQTFLRTLEGVVESKPPVFGRTFAIESLKTAKQVVEIVRKHSSSIAGSRIVAVASSTGGPKALHSVVTKLPKNLKAPVVIVQHMPAGFTESLAERLNSLSELTVSEGRDGETLENGHVYIAKGGRHLNIDAKAGGKHVIRYSDEPTREGVRPCANYMYESLAKSSFDEVLCVVMTGMGADGTVGIEHLKQSKKVHVIAQEQSTCAVYGMPRSVVKAGLSDQTVPLDQIAQEIILNVGVM
ncbi:MAG: chemotaxis response regulator protein-glutamate methylesterase [Lachnospiraceae bacterium]|nr:chemotaxis response regulator protein-glutamate methylesterase [Lachnospiraceae bacterium]